MVEGSPKNLYLYIASLGVMEKIDLEGEVRVYTLSKNPRGRKSGDNTYVTNGENELILRPDYAVTNAKNRELGNRNPFVSTVLPMGAPVDERPLPDTGYDEPHVKDVKAHVAKLPTITGIRVFSVADYEERRKEYDKQLAEYNGKIDGLNQEFDKAVEDLQLKRREKFDELEKPSLDTILLS